MIFSLLPPCKGEWLVAMRICQPLGFAGRLRFFGKESTIDFQVDSLPRQINRSSRDARLCGGKGYALVAARCHYRYVDVEREHGAPRAREQSTKMASGFPLWSRNERHLLAVESSLADQQPGRNRNAHPSIFQDIDCEVSVSLSEFASDMQVVINPCQSGVQRRRFRIVLHRISLRTQHPIFVHRNHNPSCCVGSVWRLLLSKRSDREQEGNRK